MTEQLFFEILLFAGLILALGVFITLFFVPAPYGRHLRRGWGFEIAHRMGWLIMEAIPPLGMLICFLIGDAPINPASILLLLLWEAHYIHRGFIYPFQLRTHRKKMPLLVPVIGVFFNSINSYLNGRSLFHFHPLSAGWWSDPRFVLGVVLFISGFAINRQADLMLQQLRKPGETDYKIPEGWLYDTISCPNYFGEILEWIGWAVAVWSLPGAFFALWTFANLALRAIANHKWYRATFPEYPRERKALIPFVW